MIANGLDQDKVHKVVKHFFKETCGHPRSLLTAFLKCDSFDKLISFEEEITIPMSFYKTLSKYKIQAKTLVQNLVTDVPINLLDTFMDEGNKKITYDLLANNLLITWEGEINSAKLYTNPEVLHYIQQYEMPLKNYIHHIVNARVSLDYSVVFEWIFLKRFQEMFHSATKPMDVSPRFFRTEVFGKLDNVEFGNETIVFPKFTSQSANPPDLLSATANPKHLSSLLEKVDFKMVETGIQSICLKPKGKSAFSDVVLISRSMGKRLTIGLTVKNYCGASFTNNHLEKECDLFNRMFTTSETVRSATKEGYAILIVNATQYGKTLCQFNAKHSVQ
jgi:hypothetical protein